MGCRTNDSHDAANELIVLIPDKEPNNRCPMVIDHKTSDDDFLYEIGTDLPDFLIIGISKVP